MLHYLTTGLCLLSSVLSVSGTPTLYLAGDSTMATAKSGSALQGWGFYAPSYFTNITISNQAVAGTSSRSYTRSGYFGSISNKIKKGDYVIIEFGHNDGGGLSSGDNGKAVCFGTANETCPSVYNGMNEIVYTFTAYILSATKLMQSKGATVIVASQTPNNPYDNANSTFQYSGNRFVDMAQDAATKGNVTYINHGLYAASAWQKLGANQTNADFVKGDHTHTNAAGAKIVAESFMRGLLASTSTLKKYVKKNSVPSL